MNPNNNVVIPVTLANTNINSSVQWSDKIVRASFQIVATGDAAGSLQLQVSNDQAVGKPAYQYVPTNWSNLGSAVVIAGGTIYLIAETEMSYEYLRLVYTDSSSGASTGTVAARMKSMAL